MGSYGLFIPHWSPQVSELKIYVCIKMGIAEINFGNFSTILYNN